MNRGRRGAVNELINSSRARVFVPRVKCRPGEEKRGGKRDRGG